MVEVRRSFSLRDRMRIPREFESRWDGKRDLFVLRDLRTGKDAATAPSWLQLVAKARELRS